MMMMTFARWFAAFYIFQQILPVFLLLRFRRIRRDFERVHGPAPRRAEGISVLVPVKGPEPRLESTVQSILDQDYAGEIELVLAFQDAWDPELANAERLRDEAATRPGRSVRILRGLAALGFNRKNSNLEHASRAARHDWLYCNDADTQIPPAFLRRALTRAQERVDEGVTCFFTAISVHERPRRLGAWLEAVGTNMELANYFLLTHLSPRSGAMSGASMFFRRDGLERVGGFAAFLDKISDDLALRRAVLASGAEVRLVPELIHVPVGKQTIVGFWSRQLRWQLICRCFDPFVFYALAPLNWVGQWLLLFGALGANGTLIRLGLTVLAARLARSLFFQAGLDTPAGDWLKALALPIFDLVSPLIWCNAIFTREVRWAGSRMRVARDGSLIAPTREFIGFTRPSP